MRRESPSMIHRLPRGRANLTATPSALSYLRSWKRLWGGRPDESGRSMQTVCRNRDLLALSYCRRLWAVCSCTSRTTRSGMWDRQSQRPRLSLRDAASSGAPAGARRFCFTKKKHGGLDGLARFLPAPNHCSRDCGLVGRSRLAHFFLCLRRETQRLRFLKLRGFGRAGERGGGGRAAGDGLLHRVEVTRADEALMLDGFVAERLFARELFFLQAAVGGHAVLFVIARQLEHREIERVESCQSDELEFVAHGAELALEFRDGVVVEIFAPVEGRRAIVCQHFVGILGVNRFGKLARFTEMRFGGFAPDQIGIGRVGQAASNRGGQAAANLKEAFGSALAGEEFAVARVNVAGEQV